MEAFIALFRALLNSARDLMPIVLVITFSTGGITGTST